MNEKLRVLLTNNTLNKRGGSELVVLELGKELRKRGHFPIAYSTILGQVAEELNHFCIPVIDDLNQLSAIPDVIHGQHHLDAMSAMLHFSNSPAIFVCHGWLPWEERPPRFSNIKKYIAVSELTRERILVNSGANEKDIVVIENFVDTEKFQQKPFISDTPKKALIFSNAITKNSFYVSLVLEACKRSKIEHLSILGLGVGNSTANPEKFLFQNDIIFAVGRSAIEAMATGCAVIVADPNGLAGMVNSENFDLLRAKNFALASLDGKKLNIDDIVSEISKYNSTEVKKVSDLIRSKSDLKNAADRYIEVYRQAISDWESTIVNYNKITDCRFEEASNYLRSLSIQLKEVNSLKAKNAVLEQQVQMLLWEKKQHSPMNFTLKY